MKKKLLIIFFSFLFYIPAVHADITICTSEYIEKLKVLSSNITSNYNFVGNIKFDGDYQWYEATFDFNGLEGDVYISNLYSHEEKAYTSEDKIYVSSGKGQLGVYVSQCGDYQVNTIDYDLPKFNTYSLKYDCTILGDSELDVCNPWYQANINESTFKNAIDEYYEGLETNRTLLDYINEYKFYIISVIVIIVIAIVIILFRRKRYILD